MRAFFLVCLTVAVCGDKLPYDYTPSRRSDSGLSYAFGTANNGIGANSNVAPSFAAQGDAAAATNQAPLYAPVGELEKEFFTFTANEDDFYEPAVSNQYQNSVKRGLRVIFIKGPENNGLENAAVTLAKHVAEQKTDIYVLQKQADVADLANKFKVVNENYNSKPEVHFVKYRTPEDAANAQRAIQEQYDSLGGRSQSYDGGVAPALNFASSHNSASSALTSAPHYKGEASSLSSSVAAAPAAYSGKKNYLPPSLLRLLRQ